MRRAILVLLAVLALALTYVSPVAADTGPPVSGTYAYLNTFSQDCVPQGARTTCSETGLDVFTDTPTTLGVCVYMNTYTYSDQTGRGRSISNESGCSDPVDASALDITISQDQLTATLAPTSVTLFECGRRTCTETRTVTVSAADSGGPVATFTSRSTYKDGTCTFRISETGRSAPVTGTVSVDGVAIAQEGSAGESEVKVQENCK